MLKLILTIGLILLMLLAWIAVQQVYALFAKRHPELGPFRGGSGGCGACGSGQCGSGSHCEQRPD